jgi:hypothetical protein
MLLHSIIKTYVQNLARNYKNKTIICTYKDIIMKEWLKYSQITSNTNIANDISEDEL